MQTRYDALARLPGRSRRVWGVNGVRSEFGEGGVASIREWMGNNDGIDRWARR